MIRIAILASGNGSNAENLILQQPSELLQYPLIITDNAQAGVLQRAKRLGVATHVFSRADFREGTAVLQLLQDEKIDAIVLAGFLSRIPQNIVEHYPSRIINIHPALLPRFGGKGMYGHFVHEAVLAAGEVVSGITIHYVDAEYDHGSTLCQATCPVYPSVDTPDSLAERIHHLEHLYYPVAVRQMVQRMKEEI
ncbi:phosphoribosylglycinamide formyltransferase [Porphyromonas endodontalis]|uniref:Phosphoribosylglycinamide formyltransferase n=1 Tax=Porphyromonas endodontalis (strain ATCC 35406 / DSM 24491 / JCM 8526 / CCUG 16442 / BCRC 14492 / NCTC 13058 / HG 370) TaxID=553175 RepID=C3J7U3_POREA|nr:phosphoribosylglycinamide formyltransferase [Porphyromonas endodontalis]EEN83633.1 phosphoribosylglycinamide formyltransferase [Porphyromonas endodontalis ATCC 35406]UBH65338.1 phosphoribosylglycinamide formyltransferase [Porphyromonas endodontalis]SUB68043.1 Phosphoribosylglycinamide formyltransferase [Porphyromonas endodontalis]